MKLDFNKKNTKSAKGGFDFEVGKRRGRIGYVRDAAACGGRRHVPKVGWRRKRHYRGARFVNVPSAYGRDGARRGTIGVRGDWSAR